MLVEISPKIWVNTDHVIHVQREYNEVFIFLTEGKQLKLTGVMNDETFKVIINKLRGLNV